MLSLNEIQVRKKDKLYNIISLFTRTKIGRGQLFCSEKYIYYYGNADIINIFLIIEILFSLNRCNKTLKRYS
jgi:hypothetical protein